MEQVVPLQFRPTLVIFVGATSWLSQGQGNSATGTTAPQPSVLEHFRDLCSRLDPALHSGIALLTIEEGSDDAQLYPLDGTATSNGDAQVLLQNALHNIRDYRIGLEIEDAGYPLLVRYPQIFIVGAADSAWISKVAEWVNGLLGHDRSLAHVSYMLIEESVQQTQAGAASQASVTSFPVPWRADLLAQGIVMPAVNFSNVYEELGQSLLYAQALDMRYAVAEALFALVATGISGSTSFANATGRSLMIANVEERIGSLGTSLIHFPRVPAERYCVDTHAAELVQTWIETIMRPGLSKEQQAALSERMREQARQDAGQLSDDLADHAPRPGYSERSWPDLAFLEDDTLAHRLTDATSNIFQNFQNFEEWTVDPRRRQVQAQQALQSWRAVAEAAWLEARRSLEQRINGKIDAIWLEDQPGVNAAVVYAGQFDMLLGQLRDHFTEWRIRHRRTYEDALLQLQQRGEGPWVIPPGAPALVTQQQAGTMQATPSAANVPPLAAAAIAPPALNAPPANAQQAGAPPGLNAPPTPVTSPSPPGQATSPAGQMQRVPNREQQIINNLAARLPWLRARLPTTAHILAAAAMATPALALLALCLLPSLWLAAPLLTGIVAATSAAVCMAGGWLYRQWRLREVHQAEEDLLRVYRLYFAYQCEWWEDQLRIIVLSPLIGRVRRIRARLENFASYLQSIADELRHVAERTEQELFDSPAAYRDVFIANRQILSRHGYRLAEFNQELARQRRKRPREIWHRAQVSVLEHLRAFFAERGISMIAISQDELIERLREFCRMMVAPYLQGELVEIVAALEAEHGKQIIAKALEKSSVLYRPYQNIQELTYYICARDEQREAIPGKSIPDNATMIRSADREWMLLACFWTGGARTRWSDDGSGAAGVSTGLPTAPTW
jgi:hypothetical protein